MKLVFGIDLVGSSLNLKSIFFHVVLFRTHVMRGKMYMSLA